MIKIRLQRHGARHAPFYRMVVTPSEARRDGKFIEVLGTYNPQAHSRDVELNLKMDRIDHWLEVGAKPTDTANSLIRQGRLSPEDWLKRAEKKAAAKSARLSKKKNPAPVAEFVAEEAPAEEKAEEPKAEEPAVEEKAPEPEAKEEAPAEEKPVEEKAEEPKAEEPAVEEKAPEPEAKEEAPAEEAPAEEKTKEPKAKGKKEEQTEEKEEAES
jgi:small subunit ribosomal protein S16